MESNDFVALENLQIRNLIMADVYTTEELIQILERERRACLRGERLNLTSAIARINPAIDPFLNTEAIQKFTAYMDFRATVHRYQQQHQVSSIIWRQVTIREQTLRLPEVHDQLLALPQDLELLQAYKGAIAAFWWQVTVGMELHLRLNRYGHFRPTTEAEVKHLFQKTAWASLSKYEFANNLEVILTLGWGNPREALDQRASATAGSEVVHAVPPGDYPTA